MMTIDEIRTREEGQSFDRKSIRIAPKDLAETVVAMANADGGTIAIGVSDKQRLIEGIDQYEVKLNELLRVPLDFCNPSVMVSVERVPCVDAQGNVNHVLLMNVPASSALHTTQADEAFMRVGDKSRKLAFDERVQLMYDKGERYYEDTAVYGATVGDINMEAVAEYVRLVGYGKSPMEYLRSNNGFVTKNAKGEEVVSAACILLFGKRPQDFFPRARTRFIRYEGVDEKVGAEMNVVKDVTFEGTILEQVRKTVDFIETQVREHTFLGNNGQFVTLRDYPEFVIQEMVVNAVCHRAYNIKGTEIQIKMFDDRMVYESPGKLPGMVKPENIRHTHFSRNPKIAAFLKAYNYVKEFGEGVDRIYRELEANGASALRFRDSDFILRITVPKVTENVTEKVAENGGKVAENDAKVADKVAENGLSRTETELKSTTRTENRTETELKTSNQTEKLPEKLIEKQRRLIERVMEKASFNGDKLTENRIAILRLIAENPYISKVDIGQILGLHPSSVWRNIEAMRGKYLRRVGPDKGGFWEVIV